MSFVVIKIKHIIFYMYHLLIAIYNYDICTFIYVGSCFGHFKSWDNAFMYCVHFALLSLLSRRLKLSVLLIGITFMVNCIMHVLQKVFNGNCLLGKTFVIAVDL